MLSRTASFFFILLLLLAAPVLPQNMVLQQYIDMGLESNLALKRKDFSLKQSLTALHEARGMFLPTVDINARYTRAGGGRTIEIPTGDLVNPAYRGLNQVLGQDVYPTNIPNETVNFLRKEEHETKISVQQPIFVPEIYFNYKIKHNMNEMERAERNLYARALVADIKTAYYNFLTTREVVNLYQTTKLLLEENLRVNESLYENDKATKDVVYRAQAELSELEQKLAGAERDMDLARFYFNFLLNRELDTPIEVMETGGFQLHEAGGLDESVRHALEYREELSQLNYGIQAADNNITLNKSKFLPSVVFAGEYGFQGEEYNFNDEYDYWMASLVLKWNIFNGFSDKAKVEHAEYEKQKLNTQVNELKKQIALQVREAHHNTIVADKSLKAASDRVESARKSFEIIDKKYKEGLASQIEFIDARTTMTQAEINNIVTRYDYQIKFAELEKQSATYQLKFDENISGEK